jgi:hypothetical protein
LGVGQYIERVFETSDTTKERAMAQSRTLVDRLTSRVRNNPIFAVLIMVGLAVISLASFTDALTKLFHALPTMHEVHVTGEWQSKVLIDPWTNKEYRYSFELKSDGSRLYGTARRLVPYCEEHGEAGMCANHDRPVGSFDGKLDRQGIFFQCNWTLPGAAPWTWVDVRETFHGVVSGDEIRFVLQDDQNSPPVEFRATRTAKTGPAGG